MLRSLFLSNLSTYRPLPVVDRTVISLPLLLFCCPSCFHSEVCVGQSQDDSIVGMKQSKQIPPALPVSGNLSSSNPDLLQSHHRILDFNNQPGVYLAACSASLWDWEVCGTDIQHLTNHCQRDTQRFATQAAITKPKILKRQLPNFSLSLKIHDINLSALYSKQESNTRNSLYIH